MSFDYQKPISKMLSQYLLNYLTKDVIFKIAEDGGEYPFLLWAIVTRLKNMNPRFEMNIIKLTRIAIKNSDGDIHRITKTKEDISELLDSEDDINSLTKNFNEDD